MSLARRAASPVARASREQLHPASNQTLIGRARDIAGAAQRRACDIDVDGGFPCDELHALHDAGLLSAPLPRSLGGADLGQGDAGALALMAVLREIGGGNLSLGRIYEGHVNAVMLVRRYGTASQVSDLAATIGEGGVSGVWNAEAPGDPVVLRNDENGRQLVGRKTLASGAGHLSAPLVPAQLAGKAQMVLLRSDADAGHDLSRWTAQGMRASATGTVDLTGIGVDDGDLVGEAGDYLRQPFFSGGAWRFCAVQLGAIEALIDLFRDSLTARGRDGDPFQRARIAECVMAAESARLWIERAAEMTAYDGDAEKIVSYVDLTRLVVERAALDVMDRVQRGFGLQAFLRPNPVERIARDLRTYLRQPAPDAALIGAAVTILDSKERLASLWAPAP